MKLKRNWKNKEKNILLLTKGGHMNAFEKSSQGRISLKRQKCEVYSRIVGYLRPVNQWNHGKKAEFEMRQVYSV